MFSLNPSRLFRSTANDSGVSSTSAQVPEQHQFVIQMSALQQSGVTAHFSRPTSATTSHASSKTCLSVLEQSRHLSNAAVTEERPCVIQSFTGRCRCSGSNKWIRMLFMPYITGHSLDCCRLNGRGIIAYMLCYDVLRSVCFTILDVINETVCVVV